MVQSNLFEADERHALIIGYSIGDKPLPKVKEDVKVVEAFTTRHNFDSVKVLQDAEATSEAIIDFFTDHAKRCNDHAKTNSDKKYFLLVYYSGHGGILYGTQRVQLHDSRIFTLEVEIRNFKNRYSKNSYMWGIFDSCRITGGPETDLVKDGD